MFRALSAHRENHDICSQDDSQLVVFFSFSRSSLSRSHFVEDCFFLLWMNGNHFLLLLHRFLLRSPFIEPSGRVGFRFLSNSSSMTPLLSPFPTHFPVAPPPYTLHRQHTPLVKASSNVWFPHIQFHCFSVSTARALISKCYNTR